MSHPVVHVRGNRGAFGHPGLDSRRRCWFVDSKGLVVGRRADLADHKRPYAHDHEPLSDLLSAVRALRPTALIGVSGQAQAFTRPVIEAMSEVNERPIVFAMSNPTANSECTAEQAYAWSAGRAIFTSGSPFAPVDYQGRTFVPGQANNAYIFPGVGLGVISSGARRVTDAMFLGCGTDPCGRRRRGGFGTRLYFPAASSDPRDFRFHRHRGRRPRVRGTFSTQFIASAQQRGLGWL